MQGDRGGGERGDCVCKGGTIKGDGLMVQGEWLLFLFNIND